ncbi:MAG: hypothetical protein K1X57_18770 [Gemmataceae bacterium]|nr:hypothetical protein [Gemmataceae bacterium]
MASNADIEMRWVDAWNDVYDIVGARRDAPCMLPDWSIVTLDECLGWLQESVYLGYAVWVVEGWVGHRWGIIANRGAPVADSGAAADPAS